MAGIMAEVDQRTNLVGENRMELLLFRLGTRQRFGINVFKVREVIQCPPLTRMANADPTVRGVANLRGQTISVIDLAQAVGKRPLPDECDCFVIVTEYNRAVQGFLVSGVDRIVNLNWKEISSPPRGLGKRNYMTAVTEVDGELVEIIDVEKVLAELTGVTTDLSEPAEYAELTERRIRVLIVDDSSVARNQIKRTLEQMGMECTLAANGREGLETLKGWVESGDKLTDHVDILISDVEMPEMDGYTLTTEVRNDDRLAALPVLLHTSLSGVFNKNMVQKVGADLFVPKFNADELAREVNHLLEMKGLA